MLVYLDQNKWIQLARVLYQKETNDDIAIIKDLVDDGKIVLPLSAWHYMETFRIADLARRQRLGNIMWELSKRKTLLSNRDLVIHEVEVEVSKVYPEVKVHDIELLGTGAQHTFGMEYAFHYPEKIEEIFERTLLIGETIDGHAPPLFSDLSSKQNFQEHLQTFGQIIDYLPRDKQEYAIYAMSLADIKEPFCAVMWNNGIGPDFIEKIGMEKMKEMIDNMPTRRIDVHLHKEILKNKQYFPKLNDLEDWAGLSVGSAYCDVVVCERHYKDLVSRSNFKTKATILNDLSDLATLFDY